MNAARPVYKKDGTAVNTRWADDHRNPEVFIAAVQTMRHTTAILAHCIKPAGSSSNPPWDLPYSSAVGLMVFRSESPPVDAVKRRLLTSARKDQRRPQLLSLLQLLCGPLQDGLLRCFTAVFLKPHVVSRARSDTLLMRSCRASMCTDCMRSYRHSRAAVPGSS